MGSYATQFQSCKMINDNSASGIKNTRKSNELTDWWIFSCTAGDMAEVKYEKTDITRETPMSKYP